MTEQERRALFFKVTGKVSAHAHFEYSMFCKGMDAEREECAKVCDRGDPMVKAAMTQFECAAAIRARGKNV